MITKTIIITLISILLVFIIINMIGRFISRSGKKQLLDGEGLQTEMFAAKEWIVASLNASGYEVDYSLESLIEIDRFFDEQNRPKGILSQHTGRIIFALGVYLGETVIANFGGNWVLDNCKSEIEIKLRVNNGKEIFPGIKVMERYQYGKANSLYAYGQNLCKNK